MYVSWCICHLGAYVILVHMSSWRICHLGAYVYAYACHVWHVRYDYAVWSSAYVMSCVRMSFGSHLWDRAMNIKAFASLLVSCSILMWDRAMSNSMREWRRMGMLAGFSFSVLVLMAMSSSWGKCLKMDSCKQKPTNPHSYRTKNWEKMYNFCAFYLGNSIR